MRSYDGRGYQGPDVFKRRSLRVSAGWLSVVELLVLVPASGIIVAFGWFLVLVGIVYAEIADNQRAAAVIPVVWFAILVAMSLVSAAAIGPELCPAS